MNTIESRLEELGIVLPVAAAPAANYVSYVLTAIFFTCPGNCRWKTASLP